MHLERGLLAVNKEKTLGRKVHPGDHGMLTQEIHEMRKQLHRAEVASFSAGNAVRDGVLDARGGNRNLQINGRLEKRRMKWQHAGTIRTGAFRKQKKAQSVPEGRLYFRLDGMRLTAAGAVNINGPGKSGNPSDSRPGADFTLGDKSARRYGAVNQNIQITEMVAGNQSRAGGRARDLNADAHARKSRLRPTMEHFNACLLLQSSVQAAQ